MHNADTQCRVGERRPKGRENFLCLKFSCLAIKYEFYFHSGNDDNRESGTSMPKVQETYCVPFHRLGLKWDL